MLIDSHCHLDHFDAAERAALLARAGEAGVHGMVTISTRLRDAAAILALRDSRAETGETPRIWCTIGTHPDHVDDDETLDAAAIAALTEHPGVVGIGESGLDYFHGAPEIRPLQQQRFRAHIDAARRTGLPLVIHARQADDDIAAILREESETGPFGFVLHCFSSGRALAETALELGGYVSLSGIVTFPKSDELRAIAADIPLDRLLVETDSPYLAPVPRRGKRNEPAYVRHTAERVAELRGLGLDELAGITTANFHRLFARAEA